MIVNWRNMLYLLFLSLPGVIGVAYFNAAGATTQSRNPTQTIEPILPGDPISRITCIDDYQATALIVDSVRPDSLIILENGDLIYSDEGDGSINRYSNGVVQEIATGLNNPEGIVLDDAQNIYVVEDLLSGRLLRIEPNGTTTVLLSDLESPEGLTLGLDGMLYLSTSAADRALIDPPDDQTDLDENYRSKILQVDPNNPSEAKEVLNTRPQYQTTVIDPTNGEIQGAFFSYTGLVTAQNGDIYFTNELSGFDVITVTQVPNPLPILPPVNLTLHFTSTESLFVLNPSDLPSDPSVPPQPIVSDLIAPEGTGFSKDGGFPLYVAEARIPNGGDPSRLWRVAANFEADLLCSGFDSLEDVVAVTENDETLYVSEENTGFIIALSKSNTPIETPTAGTPIATNTPNPEGTATPTEVIVSTPTGDRLTFLSYISTQE